jgi:SAM-dependent methyltransferase
MGLDDDLIAYYDTEARAGIRERKVGMRVELQSSHVDLLRRSGVRTLLDVGAGPGLDTVEFAAAGFDVTGLDLAPANVAVMASRGLQAVVGSLYRLPFPDATFDAVWTMSTFVHVPSERRLEALVELGRVVRPGGVLAIGTWGGRDYEGVPEFGEIRPRRFFSLASHERWRATLDRLGAVERFETFDPTDPSGWEYQFAVVRRRDQTPLAPSLL